jgi:hypothetical protein
MVKSEKIYSPQNYLEAVTGKYYCISGENDIEFIQKILERNGYTDELWDYPLSEIDHIVKNGLNVVLVDCMVVNSETDEFEHVYRWFEVPEDFKDEEDEYVPSAENGDYSPSNPWDAPGMKMSDFI